MKCFFVYLFFSHFIHLFFPIALQLIRAILGLLSELMGKADIANRGGIWARLKPKPTSSSWACAPDTIHRSAVCRCCHQDIWFTVCCLHDKEGFSGESVWERENQTERKKLSFLSKRRSILNKFPIISGLLTARGLLPAELTIVCCLSVVWQ